MYRVHDKTDMDVDAKDFQMTKSPIASHGDSLADQSFQSFKSKEIRDSESPTHDIKFKSKALTDLSGWNVSTSLEVTPDGKGRTTESLMTTGGLQKLPDGISEFAGKNQQMTHAYHDGDDKNFISKKAESSNTHLQETVKTGDDNFNRTESKSVTTKFSSSQAVQHHQTVSNEFDDLLDSALPRRAINTTTRKQQHEDNIHTKNTHHDNQPSEQFVNAEQRNQQTHHKQHHTDQVTNQTIKTTNQTNQKQQVVRTLQEEAELLAAKPGTIIARTVEYPDPNTKVITETKSLPDGTTVTTRKYETKSASSKTFRSSSNQEQYHTSRTVVEDRAQRNRLEYQLTDGTTNVNEVVTPQKARTVHRETTERVCRDGSQRPQPERAPVKPKSTDTLDHEVEYIAVSPAQRPPKRTDIAPMRDMVDFIETERGCAMVDNRRPVPEKYTDSPDHGTPYSRPVGTKTEVNKSVQEHRKVVESHESHSEHKEHREIKEIREETHGYPSARPGHPKDTKPDFSTHGFPSVRGPSRDEPSSRPTSRQPSESREPRPDFGTHGFPSARAPSTDEPSSRSSSRRPSDSREPKPDYTTHGFPSARLPTKDEPRSNYRQPSEPKETKPDFSTHGFPSVKSPTKRQPGVPGDATPVSAPKSPSDVSPYESTQVRRTEETRRQSTDSTYQQETTTTKRVTKVTDHTTIEKTVPAAGKPSYTKPKDADIRPVTTSEYRQPTAPEDTTKPSPAGVPSYQRPLNREPRQKDETPTPTAGKPSYTTTKTTETTRSETYEYPDHPNKPGFDEPRRDGSVPRGRPGTEDYPDTGRPRHPDNTTRGYPSTRPVPEDADKLHPDGAPSYQKPSPKPRDDVPKTPAAGKPSYTTTKTTEVTRTETYRYPDHPGKPGYREPGRDGSVPRDGSEPGDIPYDKTPRKPDYTTHGFPSARPQDDSPKQHPAGTPSYQRPLNREPRDEVPKTPTAGKPSYSTTKTTEVTTYEYPDHPGQPRYGEPRRDGSAPRSTPEPRKPDYTTHGFPSARPQRPGDDVPEEGTKPYPRGTPSYQRPLNREPRDEVPKTPTAGKPSYSTTKTTEVTTYEYPDHPGQPRYGEPRRDGSAPRSTPEPRKPDYTTHGFPSARPQRPGDDVPEEGTKPYPRGTPSYQKPLNREPRQPAGKPSYTTTETTRTETYEYPDHPGQTRPGVSPRDSDEPSGDGSPRHPDFTTQGFPSARPKKPEDDFPQRRAPSSRPVHEPADDQSTPTSTRPGSPTYSTGRPTELTDDDVFAPDRRAPSDYRVPSFQPQPDRPAGRPSYEKQKHDDEIPDDYEIMKKLAQERRVVRKERTDVTTKKISVEVSATHDAFARSLRCISPADRDHGSVRSLRTSTSSVRSSTSPDKKTRRSPSEEKTTPQKSTRSTTPRSPAKNRPRSPDAPTDRYKSSETVDLTTTRIEQDELRKRGTRVVSSVTQRTTPRDKPKETSPGKPSRPSQKPTTPAPKDITPKKPSATIIRRPSDRLTDRPHSNRPDEEGPTYYEPIERIPKDTSTTTKKVTSQTTHFTDVIQRRQTPKTPDSSKPQHPSKLEPSSPRGTRKVLQPTPDVVGGRKPSPQKSPERTTRKPTDKLPRGTTYDVEPDSPRKTHQPTSPERTTKRVTEPKKPLTKGTTYDIETCDYEPESPRKPSQPRKPGEKSPTRPTTIVRGTTYDVDYPDQLTGRKPQTKKPGEVSPTRRTPHPAVPRGLTYDIESPDDAPVVRRPRPSGPIDESPDRKPRPNTYTFDSDTEPIFPSDSTRRNEPTGTKRQPKETTTHKGTGSPWERSPDRSGTTPIDSDYDSDRRPDSKSPTRPSTTPSQRYGQPKQTDRTTTTIDYETTERTGTKRVFGEEPDQPGSPRGRSPSGRTPQGSSPDRTSKYPDGVRPVLKQPGRPSPERTTRTDVTERRTLEEITKYDRGTYPEEEPDQPGKPHQKDSPKGRQPKESLRPDHPEDQTIDLLVRRQNKDTKVTKNYNVTEDFITNERDVTTKRTDIKRERGTYPEQEPDRPGRPREGSPSRPQESSPDRSDKYPKGVIPGLRQPDRTSPDRLTRTDVTERRKTLDETVDYETSKRTDVTRVYKPQPGEELVEPGRPRGKSPSGRTPLESSPDRTGKYPKDTRPGSKQPDRTSPDRLTRTDVTERRKAVDETVDYETTKRTDVKRVYKPHPGEEPDQPGRPRGESPFGRTPQESSPDRTGKYPKDTRPGSKQPDRTSPDRLTRTDVTERRKTVDETEDYETTKRTDVKRVYKPQSGEEPDQPGRPRGKSPSGRTPLESSPDRTGKYPKDTRPGSKQPDRTSPDRLTRTDVTERRKTVDETVDYETTKRTDLKRVYKPQPGEEPDQPGRPRGKSPSGRTPLESSPDRTGKYPKDTRPGSKQPDRTSPDRLTRTDVTERRKTVDETVDYETTKRTDVKRVYKPQPGEEPDQPGRPRGESPFGRTSQESSPDRTGKYPKDTRPGSKQPDRTSPDRLTRTDVTERRKTVDETVDYETTKRTDVKRVYKPQPGEEPDQPGRPRGKSPSGRTPLESSPDRTGKYPKDTRPGSKQPDRTSADRLTRTDVTERRKTVDETVDYETTKRTDVKRVYKPQPGEEPDQPGRPRGESPFGRTSQESSPDRTGKYPKDTRPGSKQPDRTSPDRLTRTDVTERRKTVDETVDYETTKRTDLKRVYKPQPGEEPDQPGRPRGKSPSGRTPLESSPDRTGKYPKDTRPGSKQPDRTSPDRLTRTDVTERRKTVDETEDYETTKRTDVKRVHKPQPGEEPDQPGRPRGKSPSGRTPLESSPDRTGKYPKDTRPGSKQPDRTSHDRLTRTDVTERRKTVDETVDYETTKRTDLKRVYKPQPGEEPDQPGRPRGKSPPGRTPLESSPDRTGKYPKDTRPGSKQTDRTSPDRLTRTDVTERRKTVDETVDYETSKRTDVTRIYKPQPGEEPDQPGRPRGKSPSGRTPLESSPDRTGKYPKDTRPGSKQPDRTSHDRLTRTDVTERRKTVDETVDYETTKRTDVKRVYKPQPGEEPDQPGRPRGKSPSGRTPLESSPDRTGKYPKDTRPGSKQPDRTSPDRLTRTDVTERRKTVDETVDYETTKRTDVKRVYKPQPGEEPDQPERLRGKSPSSRTPQGRSPDRTDKYPKEARPDTRQPNRTSPDRLTRTNVTERKTVDVRRTDVTREDEFYSGEECDQPGRPLKKSPQHSPDRRGPSGIPQARSPDRADIVPKETHPTTKRPDRTSPDRLTRMGVKETRTIVDETVDHEYYPEEEPDKPGRQPKDGPRPTQPEDRTMDLLIRRQNKDTKFTKDFTVTEDFLTNERDVTTVRTDKVTRKSPTRPDDRTRTIVKEVHTELIEEYASKSPTRQPLEKEPFRSSPAKDSPGSPSRPTKTSGIPYDRSPEREPISRPKSTTKKPETSPERTTRPSEKTPSGTSPYTKSPVPSRKPDKTRDVPTPYDQSPQPTRRSDKPAGRAVSPQKSPDRKAYERSPETLRKTSAPKSPYGTSPERRPGVYGKSPERKPASKEPRRLSQPLQPEDLTIEVVLQKEGRDIQLSTTVDETRKTTTVRKSIDRNITDERVVTGRKVVKKVPQTSDEEPEEPEEIYEVPSDEENRPREPFFLNPTLTETTEVSRVGKTKPRAPLIRSETYEERCRKMLGMDEPEESPKTRPSRYEKTSDFVQTEREIEEVTRSGERTARTTVTKSPQSPRKTSPTKPVEDSPKKRPQTLAPSTRSPAPSREISPTKKVPKEDVKKPVTKKPTSPERQTYREPKQNDKPKASSPARLGEEPESDEYEPDYCRAGTDRRPSYSTTAEIIIRDVRHRSVSPDKTTTKVRETVKRTKDEDHTTVTRRTSKTTTEAIYVDDEYEVDEPRKPKDKPDQGKTPRTHLLPGSPRKVSSPERRDLSRPDTNVTRTTKGSTTTTKADTTTSKSTVTKSTLVKPSKDKLPSSQAPNDYRPKDGSPQRKPSSGIKKPKTTDQSDRESEIPSDEELIVTSTTKTTTSRTPKKLPVTERKDSAPVHPVTKREKPTQKMTRSTSDNVIKTTIARKPKPDTNAPLTRPNERTPQKAPADKRPTEKTPTSKRPTKCMTTKTINLSPTTNLLTTEDLENVIIDIQQAKSSREPTPNKIVPTPVSQNIETGTPRYPDTVQEPDEEPRRRPKVKNIPIFEEETSDFVGCHITEVDDHPDTVIETTTYITKVPREESPTRNLRTTTIDQTTTDECLLSVHDKVNKFITTAEEVKKSKPSAPFRPSPRLEDVPDDDECLLSVNEKVTKFLTTAEEVSKPLRPESFKKVTRPDVYDIEEDLRTDECVLSVSEKVNKFTTSAQKLVDTSPQKSPGLVAKVTKQVHPRDRLGEEPDEDSPEPSYRQPSPQRSPGLVASIEKRRKQPEQPEEEPEYEAAPRRPKHTVAERYKPDKPKEVIRHTISPSVTVRSSVQKVKSVFEKEPIRERPKQRDVPTRPSVFDGKRPKDVKLEDIGIHRSPEREVIEVTKTTITHRERSPVPEDHSRKPKTPSKVHKVTNDIVSSKKDLFEKRISSTKHETVETHPSTTVISRHPSKTTPTGQKPSSITRIAEKFSTPSKPATQPTKSTPRTIKPTGEESSPSRRTRPVPSESPRRPANLSDIFTEPRDDSPAYPKPAPRTGSHPQSREDSPRRVARPSTLPERKPKPGQVEYIEEEYYSKRRTSRTDEEIVTREQTDSTRRVRNGDMSPSRHYMEQTVSSMEHRRDSDLLAPGLDRPHSPRDLSPSHHYMEQTVSSMEHRRDSDFLAPGFDRAHSPRDSLPRSSSPSPTRHFMEQTVSSFEHRRDSDLVAPTTTDYHCHPDDHRPASKIPDSKFGVELKRTPLKDAKPRRKSSSSDIPHVEEVFDLELLEKMLETVIGYEQRRRIRAQIRVVKKMIETQEQTKRITQVTRKVTESSPQRKPSVPSHTTPRKSEVTETSTVLYTGKPREIIYIPTKTTTTMTSTRTEFRKVGKGPEKIVTTTKKTVLPKEKTPKDEKPIWASKNILKKPSENDRVTKTSTVTKKTSGALTAKQRVTATTVTNSDEDCITSSYGIGPTDEDGKPLFGIRALKKKTTTSTTPKVTGKIITEKYYSENGAEPVGERTVVMYGTDTDDIDNLETIILDDDDNVETKVIKKGNVKTTITRKGNLPSNKDAKIIPEVTETTSKVVRRGSVKEISEKFVRKESSSSLSEKTSTSYPKAGLILRTQTKTTTKSGSPGRRTSRPQSDEYEEVTDENAEVYSTTSSTRKQSKTSRHFITESESETESMKESRIIIDGKETRSFLDSQGTKVTGVKDVIERMQNADYAVDDSDTTEDQEARSLLNKFLGASVLMSGVETMVPKEVTTTRITTSPLTKEQVTTTRVTKTIKSGSSSSPVVSKTCDIEEIVDEHILKQLLEESTNYEDRRRIRARLRQIMADREACTDAVEEEQVTTEETRNGKIIKTTTTTRKTANGGKEEVETTVEEEEVSEEEEEEDEEEEEEEDEEQEEIVDATKVVVVKKEEEKKQEDDDNESDYEVEEVIEVVEVTESEEEEEQEDGEEEKKGEKVETITKVETTDGDGVSKNTTVSVEKDGNKIIKTTTTVVKESASPLTLERRELISKLEAESLMEKPQISGGSNTGEEGESLLLPLLQGLLHKNMPPVRNQSNLNSNNVNNNKNKINNNLKDKNAKDSNNNKINFNAVSSDSSGNSLDGKSGKVGSSKAFLGAELNQSGSFHHVEDSGTESGEDLKLIAAGLRSSMARNVDEDDSNHDIIEDVTLALKRLETSLLDGKDIKLDSGKRSALLNLVGRLQQGLKAPDKIDPTAETGNANDENADEDEPKRPSRSSQRFAKRRNRANRHTVGVSREELADARRYIEEMVLLENISNSTTPESNPATTPTEPLYAIVKQSSLGSVVGKNTAAQPESVLYRPNQFLPDHLKDSNKSTNDSKVEGVVQMREKKSNVAQFRQSLSFDAQTSVALERKSRPFSESYVDVPKQVLGSKPLFTQEQVKDPEKDVIDKKVQEKNLYNKTHHSYQPPWAANFNRSKPNVTSAEAPSPTTDSSKSNKFMNKKMMMKRANTIDIPKPMKYMNDMDTDSDAEDNGVCSTKSIGLRGTVQVNIKNKPKQVVPSFEPKTENDHKFLAFIQKQKTQITTPGWNNPKTSESTGANWSNKFGNIKHNFEAGAVTTQSKPPMPTSSARNFWKKAESTNPVPNATPRIQQRLKMPSSPINKPEDKIVKPPWADPAYNSSDIVTGSLRIREPPSQRMHSESPKIFIPKPIPVNKFSHAPMSAFKPVAQPKVEPVQFKPIISEQNPGPTTNGSYSEPLYTYASRPQQSPQRLLYPQNTVNQSPTVSIPWARQPNIGNRVLDKASKIETQQSYSESEYDDHSYGHQRSPQPLSSKLQQNSQIYNSGGLNAPNLVRSFQNTEPISDTQYSGYANYNPNISSYSQNDSLVNPNAQPLVLTCDTPIISPQTNKQEPLKIFDYPSPSPTTCTTQYEMSDDGMDLSEVMEYKAESKVMQAPVSQQAVTVSNRTNRVGENLSKDKNTSAAKNLLSTMKDIGSKKGGTSPNMPPKSSPAPIYSGFRGSFTDVVFPAEPIDDRNMPPQSFQGPSGNQPYQPQYSPMVPESPQTYVPPQSYIPPQPSQKPYMPPPLQQSQGYVPQSPQGYVPTQQQKGPQPYSASSNLKPQSYSSSTYQSKSSAPTTPVNETPQTSYYTQNVVQQGPPNDTQSSSGGYQSLVSQQTRTYQPSWSSKTSQPLSPGSQPYAPVQNSQPMNYQPSWESKASQPLSPGKTTQPLSSSNQPYVPAQDTQMPNYQPSWESKASQPLSPGKTTQPLSTNQSYAPVQNSQPMSYQPSWDSKTSESLSPGKTTQPLGSGTQPYVPAQNTMPNYQPSWESKASQPLSPGKPTQPLSSGTQPYAPVQNNQTANYQRSWESMSNEPLSPGKASQPLSPGNQPYVPAQTSQLQNYQPSWESKTSQPLSPGNQPYVPVQNSQIPNYQPSWETKASQPLSLGSQSQSNQKPTAYQPEVQQQPKINQQSSNYQSWSYNENQSKNIEPSLQKKSAPSSAPASQKMPTLTTQQGSQSYNYQQKTSSASYSANLKNRKQETESLKSFSMPTYQKNLTSASVKTHEKEVTQTVPARAESPVKATAPKTDKIPVFKKFGPAQPHSYTPNAYQNPLAPQSKESRNRFQNRVGSAMAPRKFSEPEIKFSEFQTKQTTQTTQLKLQTETSKFTAPKIVEIPSTPRDELPSNVVFNNVGQRPFVRQIEAQQEGDNVVSYRFPIAAKRMNALSKSDSWHQICQQSQQPVTKPPSPRSFGAADVSGHQLRRAKSGHSLAVPKLFEAGIDKSQISEKQRTVAAYFSGQKSPSRNSPQNVTETITATQQTKQVTATSPTSTLTKRSSINRVKTSSKASISNQNPSSGLVRSQTMPHIPNVRLLDEKVRTTETTETKEKDGAVVTTKTKVTTRTVASTPKVTSPFALFKQLDKQNPSHFSTPTQQAGKNNSAPIFKFTDPALSVRAATVKEQLLQWCQMKTKEYENVQISNFSTSWSDGLAFCALIHHFLPDAFDYSKLTPQQRRHNFELAFRVADEKAGIAPLLDVEDMVIMKRPDWKCVFTYVQTIYRRFHNSD